MQLTLPELITPRTIMAKELLQDSRRGNGRCLKWLRHELATTPRGEQIRRVFLKEKELEEESMRQRDKLNWAKMSSSKPRKVDTALKLASTFTNPCGTGSIPYVAEAVVERKLKRCKDTKHLMTDPTNFF